MHYSSDGTPIATRVKASFGKGIALVVKREGRSGPWWWPKDCTVDPRPPSFDRREIGGSTLQRRPAVHQDPEAAWPLRAEHLPLCL
eukprot:6449086-Lingulodinium_polyedra.AAC.1